MLAVGCCLPDFLLSLLSLSLGVARRFFNLRHLRADPEVPAVRSLAVRSLAVRNLAVRSLWSVVCGP